MTSATGVLIIQLAVSAFFAILFLQSGIDKIVDWKGNLEFHSSHFATSPLNAFSKPMLIVITMMEVTCGFLALVGIGILLFNGQKTVSTYAMILAAINFICLFFGQRLSKDYKGAAVLVPYFILSIIGIFFLM